MAEVIIREVRNPHLENRATKIVITVDLSKHWERIENKSYITVTTVVVIPVLEGMDSKEIEVRITQEYKVQEIEEDHRVIQSFEITQYIDETRKAKARAGVLSYSKENQTE